MYAEGRKAEMEHTKVGNDRDNTSRRDMEQVNRKQTDIKYTESEISRVDASHDRAVRDRCMLGDGMLAHPDTTRQPHGETY